MATIPTNNPVPSTSPQDLKFNAEKMDLIVSSQEKKYTDRKGVSRKTWAAIESGFDEIVSSLDSAGVITVPDIASGMAQTTNGQYFRVILGAGNKLAFSFYRNINGQAVLITNQVSDKYYDDLSSEVTELSGYVDTLVGFTTLATISDLTGSNYIRKADGSRVASSLWRNSTFLAVKKGQNIILSAANNNADLANIAFYDSNRVFISGDNVGVGPELYKKHFVVPADGFVILATRTETTAEFSCSLVNDVLTSNEKDTVGGYASFDTFSQAVDAIAGDGASYKGASAFLKPGFASSGNPKDYPTASSTAFSSGFVKVTAGSIVTASVAMSGVGYAIAFYSAPDSKTFVGGVIGSDADAIREYSYKTSTAGYVVVSVTHANIPDAVQLSGYKIRYGVLSRNDVDASLSAGVVSIANLAESRLTDVYYDDADAKSTTGGLSGVYIGADGRPVISNSHRLYRVALLAGESVYAKVNMSAASGSVNRGISVISKYVSSDRYDPVAFCFIAGAAYTEHVFTATEDTVVFVGSYITENQLPAIIRKRKYVKGNTNTKEPLPLAAWERGVLHSLTASGRMETNLSYMTTQLIPVAAGDVVIARTVQNSSIVGGNLNMGAKYSSTGKFISATLTYTFNSNSEYGSAAMLATEDGYVAVNHYIETGLVTPEVYVIRKNRPNRFNVRAPASNPYGDIYPGRGYTAEGVMVPVTAAVVYLFDRRAVPTDAKVTVSFSTSGNYRHIIKFRADRTVYEVVLLPASRVVEYALLDLFNSDEVQFVGITQTSDGRRDGTKCNITLETYGSGDSFFALSEPVYNLYELAGRPEKTLSYNYTPLLQRLCIQMERQQRGAVYLESGLYFISGCYIKSFNRIYGDGMYNTIISGSDIPFKNEKLSHLVYEKISLEDMGFNLDLLPNRAGRGINMEYVKDFTARNIWIYKSYITGFGVDMIMSGVLDHIVTEGCGQAQGDGSCAGMGIGVGAFLAGQEPIQVINCINRNNYGHGMFFEWHNHRESSGETVIGDFPAGINVVNCYSEGNAVGFGNAGGNGVSFVNCVAYRNLNGFAADNGSQVGEVRYGKNAVFSDCKALENGPDKVRNPYFTPRQMRYGNGNGFAIYKTSSTNPEIGDASRGYYLSNCISEDNQGDGLSVSAAANVTSNITEVSVNGGSFSRNNESGIHFRNKSENVMIRGAMIH